MEVELLMDTETLLEEKKLSRRGILKGVAGAAGIAALTMGGLGFLSQGEAAKTDSATLPYPYKKFTDAEIKQAGDIAHDNWFKGFCSFATLSGGVEILRKKVGEPYKSFPMDLTTFAHGGTSGWGGTCGTLIGAGVLATLCAGPKIGEAINNEVCNYYANTALPVFMPTHPKAQLKTQNVSNSPVCHLSVGKWMKKEGVGFLSPQQMERCARVASDMCMQTLVYLNQWADGKFEAKTKAPVFANEIPSQNNCTECHGTDIPKTSGPFATGLDLLKAGH
ncbi:MAG: hypothetical protein WA610_03655 [Thermodesulfovibrionales bacterium]